MGLMTNCGFSEEVAKAIEYNFNTLYKVSVDWVAEHIEKAKTCGYITTAFGLRVRTPILAKTLTGSSVSSYQVEKEARTAGNALGQAWCLLNSRAANEFMNRVRANPTMRTRVKLCMQIHDAIYVYWADDMVTTLWVNSNLTECMQWQDDPAIYHDEVKLYGNLDIFYPSWKDGVTLPMVATEQDIITVLVAERQKRIDKRADSGKKTN